jgi:hypothetical protein
MGFFCALLSVVLKAKILLAFVWVKVVFFKVRAIGTLMR